jgi:hypothetical protein
MPCNIYFRGEGVGAGYGWFLRVVKPGYGKQNNFMNDLILCSILTDVMTLS